MSNLINDKNFLNKFGFSMIEIMVAFTILVMAFMSIIQSFPFGMAISKDSEMTTTASYLAQEKLEEITSLGYGNINIGEIESKHRLSSDSSDFKYSFQRQTVSTYVDSDFNDSVTNTGMIKIVTTVFYSGLVSRSEESYSAATLISEL